ncbi:MAG: four-carbon acid sugar kinase family protein [Anaerolineae bacterium]
MDEHTREAETVPAAELLACLPPEWPEDLLPAIRARLHDKVVVLDDDPTGTQTVHGVPVLTEWSVAGLREELGNALPAFYILTNSRSLPLEQARDLNAAIGRNLAQAARETDRRVAVVSRSDSTLRGHFPGEVQALAESLGGGFHAWLLIPFFLEGGRYTIDDVHYVAEGSQLVPAGRTEFARDAAFGYCASNLRRWVEEKTEGRVSADAVSSLSLADIRLGGPERVRERLLALASGSICVVNAAGYRDLEVLVQGLLAAEAQGCRFLCRTAASFVRVRSGLEPRPLLDAAEMGLSSGKGSLMVVGSYVPRTTAQLAALLARPGVLGIEVDVAGLLGRSDLVDRVAREADQGLQRGAEVVIHTSRELVRGRTAHTSLEIGRRVSEGLVAIVRAIATRPRYLLAKGGITSSDVATQGLGVKRALVLGQILPGVPVWRLGPESHYPGMPYIVFPGNVGGPNALAEIVANLANTTSETAPSQA